ncbi:MAG TPA: ATP-binding protein, partial [Blastocatellia bacterium]|nr:ATP-binding protein [Blastocatellia bacterium]
RLQQIVGNLLTNAVKFTPEEGRISVRLAQLAAQAQLIVSDTGKGIKGDFLPHVFDMFRQDDTTSRRKFGGLGLGLSIVRYLVEMHGGTVRAESEGECRGSTFIVTLPIAGGVQRVFDEFAEPASAGSNQTAALNHKLEGLRILAVDDEADTVEMLRVVFEQLGAKVITAMSCAEAIKAIDGSSRPDILIADIAMPVENGFDLIRKIRSMGPGGVGNIPAIALTAYAGQEDRLRALAAGFQMHLSKPVSIHDLISCVVKLTHRE